MSMTVKRRKDTGTKKVLMHRIADIRGGVSVNVTELGDDFLNEGVVLSKPDANGICHVVKVATVYAEVAADATAVKVNKLSHIKVGDIVMLNTGSTAVAVTAIDKSNKSYDTLTLSATLGAIEAGEQLAQAKEEQATGYVACESTDEGALKVVTADAAEGQILKANVTPWLGEGSAPNANTYVKLQTANSELKYAPLSINGTGKPVIQGTNLDTDAWVIGVTKGNSLPAFIAEKLTGIVNY